MNERLTPRQAHSEVHKETENYERERRGWKDRRKDKKKERKRRAYVRWWKVIALQVSPTLLPVGRNRGGWRSIIEGGRERGRRGGEGPRVTEERKEKEKEEEEEEKVNGGGGGVKSFGVLLGLSTISKPTTDSNRKGPVVQVFPWLLFKFWLVKTSSVTPARLRSVRLS
ncbi:hypothetical protein E2C01_098239 [Portunus trituberculatus]|uniref:Uncharacterized protein n=1 Tax=Portunus trituberculatus TaxID=210409 RepID=A0A5B7K2I1_PORTR|nr:hypothetical protein [Portunus trituberculatus]